MEKATCILIITASPINKTDVTENIVYAHFKEVYEKSPKEKIYFYPNYGDKGIAKQLAVLNGHNFKQWFAITSVQFANEIVKCIKSKNEFKIGNNILDFIFDGEIELYETTDSSTERISIPCDKFRTIKYRYTNSNFLKSIFFDSYKDDFAKNLHDINQAEYSSKIFPFGFLFLPKLKQDLENDICIIQQKLHIPNSMHGENGKKVDTKQAPSKFVGFIQDSPIKRKSLGIVIKDNDDFTDLNDSQSVNKETGIWTFETQKPIDSGFWAIIDKNNKAILAKEKFSLVTSIVTNMEIISDKIIDLYGKEVSYSRKVRDEKKTIKIDKINKVFYRENYSNFTDEEYDITISKWFTNLLTHCAPNILIYDPYLLGNFEIIDDKVKINRSQRVFLNALMHALTKVKIESLEFLCMSKRVKSFWGNRNSFPTGYIELFNQINKICKVKINIRVYDKIFHNRHIIKKQDTPEIIELSVSLNGLVAEDEIEIRSLSINESNKIASRIFRLWETAENTECSL